MKGKYELIGYAALIIGAVGGYSSWRIGYASNDFRWVLPMVVCLGILIAGMYLSFSEVEKSHALHPAPALAVHRAVERK